MVLLKSGSFSKQSHSVTLILHLGRNQVHRELGKRVSENISDSLDFLILSLAGLKTTKVTLSRLNTSTSEVNKNHIYQNFSGFSGFFTVNTYLLHQWQHQNANKAEMNHHESWYDRRPRAVKKSFLTWDLKLVCELCKPASKGEVSNLYFTRNNFTLLLLKAKLTLRFNMAHQLKKKKKKLYPEHSESCTENKES